MNKNRILGIILILTGIILILSSQTALLGAVVGLKKISSGTSLIIGIMFITLGIAFLIYQQRYHSRFKSKDSLTEHNQHAHYSTREHFKQVYGRYPNSFEEKKFRRILHERGELSDVVFETGERKRKSAWISIYKLI